jgi:glutamate/tyrosine decarboxylase-like PLP-dependent enzyme
MDNVSAVVSALRSLKNYNPSNVWIHVDAAWCGPYSRFLQIGYEKKNPGKEMEDLPAFDFSIPEVKTICTSIHKWIPSPFPSSIFLIRDKKYLPETKDYKYITGYVFISENILKMFKSMREKIRI